MFRFVDLWLLWLIIGIIPYIYYLKKYNSAVYVRFSWDKLMKNFQSGLRVKVADNLIYLRVIVLALMCLALARPQSVLVPKTFHSEGIDIVLAVDSSGSMRAEDFKTLKKKN